MSVYIIDPVHIDLILSVAINGPKGSDLTWHGPYVNELLEDEGLTGPVRVQLAKQAGRELLRECIASVGFVSGRGQGRLPGPNPNPLPELYEWTDFGKPLTPIESCKAIIGYKQQSSHHRGWHGSGARSFCERLTDLLLTWMAGYQEAEEQWTVEKALECFRLGDP